MKLGLIGRSISYSLSPKIHTYWLNLYQIPGSYHLYDEDYEDVLGLIYRGDVDGLNVTIPYKTKILDLLPHWSSPLMAVNTLVFSKNGISGMNTDYETARDIFAAKKPQRITILGSGGAAKAMIYAAKEVGCPEIHVCSRQNVMDEEWHPWTERDKIIQAGGLLVNATSVKDKSLMENWDLLTTHTGVIDLTYDTTREPYLTQIARFKGLDVITGKEFLVRQAQKSFQYWTGVCPKITPDLLGMLI